MIFFVQSSLMLPGVELLSGHRGLLQSVFVVFFIDDVRGILVRGEALRSNFAAGRISLWLMD